MTQRDELIQDVTDGSKRMHVNTSYGLQEAIAEHLRQLGYRKPRMIETADEVDGLPVGAVVLDAFAATCTKIDQSELGWRRVTSAVSGGAGHWHKPYLPGAVLSDGAT